MKICERCGKEHDGTYGTGRYCSKSCANARDHSDETKRKISNTLKVRASNMYDGKTTTKKEYDKILKQQRKQLFIDFVNSSDDMKIIKMEQGYEDEITIYCL